MKRIVATQRRPHIDSNDLGNTFQSAYKAGHSKETALLCIQNEIHLSLSKDMPTALVLLDLLAAFDTMIHFSAACQLCLALLVQSVGGLQHIFWIVLNLLKLDQ